MTCWMIAAKALKECSVQLKGDVVMAAVCGEMCQETVDEFQPPAFVSKDIGARFLATHGGVADYAIIAETSGLKGRAA